MEIENTGKEDGYFIVTVTGRMDATTAPEFEAYMGRWIGQGEVQFIVDFGGLEYISSAGLRSILTTTKSLKAKQGKLILCALRDTVKEVFEISGFSTIIPVYDSVEVAVKKG